MSDYAKKKNDELSALCKERGLPHNGKKADLVKRLEEYDANAAAAAPAKNANEDEIDWDEEPAADAQKPTSTEPVKAAANNGAASKEVAAAVPEQSAEAPAAESHSALSEATLDTEIEKRKARARRFGLPEDSEEIKMLERAKRFGSNDLPGLLNKALSTERKRGSADAEGGVRKKSKGRPGPGKSQEKPQEKPQANGAAKPNKPTAGKTEGGYPAWMSAEDREKAEKRKAKWATTSSA